MFDSRGQLDVPNPGVKPVFGMPCRLLPILTLLVGCSCVDPWCETARTPRCPSDEYPTAPALVAKARPGRMPREFEGRTLSLAECMVIALERNPKTRISWQASRSAAFQVGQQRSAWLPTLDFTAAMDRNDTIEQRDKDESPNNAVTSRFGVRYLLSDGGLRNAQVSSAESELLAADFRHNTVLQEVALAVELAYQERLAARALVRVAEENVRRSQYNLDLAQARHAVGEVARFDVLAAETEKANADLGLVRARNARRITRGQLAEAMGLTVSEEFDIEDLPIDVQPEELADVELLLAEAARIRPELQTSLALTEARRSDIRAARSEYWPKVRGTTAYGFADETFLDGGQEWFIGLSVEQPLFTGFARTYREAGARAEFGVAAAEYENLLRGVELEVWTAYSQLIEAGEAMEAAKKLVASADEAARAAEGRYRAGAGNIIELVAAQTAETDAQVQQVRAVLSWYTAMARFQRAIGQTLADTN